MPAHRAQFVGALSVARTTQIISTSSFAVGIYKIAI